MEEAVKSFFKPDEIEKQLSQLQKEASPGHEREILFNLVLVSDDSTEKTANMLLDGLMGKRSARIIHIKNSSADKSSLRLSARCSLDRARRGVCFQEIIIENGRDNAGAAPGTWTGLLVRDLPVISLWLPSPDVMSPLFLHLEDHVDKIIVDFLTLERLGILPRDFISRIELDSPESLFILSDMHWQRLLDARRQIALFMDNKGLCDLSDRIKKLSISGMSASGFFLIKNWLADRLGWKNTEPAPPVEQKQGRPGIEIIADKVYHLELTEPDINADTEILRKECDNPEPDGFFLRALQAAL